MDSRWSPPASQRGPVLTTGHNRPVEMLKRRLITAAHERPQRAKQFWRRGCEADRSKTMYRLEPVTECTATPQWTIELEVGNGVGRGYATITDLRYCKWKPTRNGNNIARGARTLTLSLEGGEMPTKSNAVEIAEDIALALLEADGKAKPTDIITVVCHDGLTAKTAHQMPWWQSQFRYVAGARERESIN